jgi:hypothetical protein
MFVREGEFQRGLRHLGWLVECALGSVLGPAPQPLLVGVDGSLHRATPSH